MMKEFLTDDEAKDKKEKLDNEMNIINDLKEEMKFVKHFKTDGFKDGINWLDTERSYEFLKSIAKTLDFEKNPFLFLAHDRDEIKGKPQLIHQTMQRICLIRRIVRERKGGVHTEEGDMTFILKYIDEPYDKRYDGQFEAGYYEDFWVYKIVGEDDKESYVLSKNKLENVHCRMRGMHIQLEDVSEFSNSMKIKSISSIFLLKDWEPNVKIVSKEELIKMTKDITEDEWFNFLGYHVDNENINEFPDDVKLLRSIFILAGKYTNYPLHICVMGRPGTKKTAGHIETLSVKFDDDPIVVEGANSRIKGLSPSFKEKPANIGDIARADRIVWIDELGKMIEFESNKHQSQISNILGELNFLLEHKKRTVSSGNDNGCEVQATAKVMFVTNPVSRKRTLHSHVGLIDPTMMSRVLWWVQDDEETEFALSEKSINENPPHTKTSPRGTTNNKIILGLALYRGNNLGSRDALLSLFDTCYSFISNIEKSKIQQLVDMSVNLCEEPMKSSVWKPRAFHHIFLLVDGVVKHRCLFKDHTTKFTAKKEDYEMVSKLLIRLIKSYETKLVDTY